MAAPVNMVTVALVTMGLALARFSAYTKPLIFLLARLLGRCLLELAAEMEVELVDLNLDELPGLG